MKTVFGMAKINWRYTSSANLIVGITFAVGVVNYIVSFFVNNSGVSTVPIGNYLYLLPVFMGIFVCARNFPNLMNLGGKRMDFYKSGLLTYAPVAAVASAVSIVINITLDRWIVSQGMLAPMLDLLDQFGFMSNGVIVAFFQMTAFLLLASVTAHTLTLIQGYWYGWVTDAVIVAIISVFTPIAPLRSALLWFFDMIIFHETAIIQILSCLVLSAAIYAVSIIPIKNKQI